MDRRMEFPWDAQQYVIGIALDMEKGKEYVCIGEMPEVMETIKCLQDSPGIVWARRPLGSFLFDCFERIPQINDFVYALVNKDNPDHERAREQAADLFVSRNLGHGFIAVRLWQQIAAWTQEPEPKRKWFAPKQESPEDEPDRWEWIERLIRPLNISFLDMVLEWQRKNAKEPLNTIQEIEYEMLRDEFTGPLTTCFSGEYRLLEFAIADENILPLILYYLKRLYEHKKYVRKCPVCGKLFLANTAKVATLCSKECRQLRQRERKRRHDMKTRNVEYERQHKNAYMYWYKRVIAAKSRQDISSERLQTVQGAFAGFNKESNQKKKQVKGGKLSIEEYRKWLNAQRYVISSMVDTQ